ncbi:isoprenylcysteine carboxylmethyltransferase family protein [Candidatus Woesearchaeota archaeon]|nr:isoprenylcysteine carboxylmethyltransferase family protein [Candidatus Woesearchaeota archaeon]
MNGFEVLFLIMYITAAIGRAPFAYKVRQMKAKVSFHNLREYVLALVSGIGMMILPLIFVFTDWLDAYDLNLPFWVKICGIVGFGFAVFLHNWSHIALGTNWSPVLELKRKQTLIMAGPYKYVRHPMYLAFLLWAVFQGILLSNIVVLFYGILFFEILYFSRVLDEEKMMIQAFGDEYQTYSARTGRLFPKINQ